jgi:hypothetical protein
MEPALLDRDPMHQFWPYGLSLRNQCGIDAGLGRGLGPRADGLRPCPQVSECAPDMGLAKG